MLSPGLLPRAIFTVVLSAKFVGAQSTMVTDNFVADLKVEMKSLIQSTTQPSEDNKPYYHLLAGFLRLGFHDCIGGCDGCLNVNNNDNTNLHLSIDILEPLYANVSTMMSRADLWALASISAAELGVEISCINSTDRGCNVLNVPFRLGRRDCPTAPYSSDIQAFPAGELGSDGVLDFFKDTYGFNAEESVVALGAHVLGGVRFNNEHILHQWAEDPTNMNNEYYVDLLMPELEWTPMEEVSFTANTTVWRQMVPENNLSPPRRVMLNADMALVKNMTFVQSGPVLGAVTCDYTSCPDSSTKPYVEQLADDNKLWIRKFGPVFQRVIEKGYSDDDLSLPIADSISGSGDLRSFLFQKVGVCLLTWYVYRVG